MVDKKNKLAIITGASSGIGASAAALFMAENYRVINVSRRECVVVGVENLCCDLADADALQQTCMQLKEACKQAGEVALVHNAAFMTGDAADDCALDGLDMAYKINIRAPSLINKALLADCGQGSSVIFVGSTLSEKAVAGSYSYVTTKHAVAGMMKSLCQDLFGKGIHTACVCPGFTDTEMLRSHIPDEKVLLEIGANNGRGRLVRPEEIAELIVWAHQNPVINGSMLHANLGQKEY